MEKLRQHITAFSELMAEKGYNSYFLTCSDNPAKLSESLKGHVEDQLAKKQLLNDFSLTLSTHSDWKDDNSDYTFCFFKVEYTTMKGFQVREMEIERTNIYGNKGSREMILVKNNKGIPTREAANKMVNPPIRQLLRQKPRTGKMRFMTILLIFCFIANQGRAQNVSEWINQKATQKKYLIQQIAALQVYIGYAKKGYKIADEGLKTIGKWSKGEFDLHKGYFNSLAKVNPSVKGNPKINEILVLRQRIIQEYNELRNSDIMNSDERAYFKRVFDRVLADCNQQLDHLTTVITDNKLEMKDDERLQEIDKIHARMLDNYDFANSFCDHIRIVSRMRMQERKEIEHSRALQGILNL